MSWTILFLAAFLAGLALAVHSMLLGVERWRRKNSSKPSPVFNPPTAAALGIGFGATGYLVSTGSGLGWPWILLISLAAGVAGMTGMIILMARWALRAPVNQASIDDEAIHGQIAVVTKTITEMDPGEITYSSWGATHTVRARSVDGSPIHAETEVVIETLEDGIALVEPWSVVEQRL